MNGRASSSDSGATPSCANSQFSVPTRSRAVSTRVPSRSMATTAPASPSPLAAPLGSIDDRSRLVEVGGIGLQRLGGDADVFLRVVEPALLDGLAHPWQGLGA